MYLQMQKHYKRSKKRLEKRLKKQNKNKKLLKECSICEKKKKIHCLIICPKYPLNSSFCFRCVETYIETLIKDNDLSGNIYCPCGCHFKMNKVIKNYACPANSLQRLLDLFMKIIKNLLIIMST